MTGYKIDPDFFQSWVARVDQQMVSAFAAPREGSAPRSTERQEATLLEACRYPLQAGGKRVRPLLVVSLAGAWGGDAAAESAVPAAAAIELVHTYSLVHDDLPCMDNDDFRRGRPTTHRVYGEAQALLVGDALLTEAFAQVAQVKPATLVPELVRTLASRAGVGQGVGQGVGMILGQWLDLALMGTQGYVDVELLERIHGAKTGALLGAAFELGTRVGLEVRGGISPELGRDCVRRAYELGAAVGLAFQLMDDWLDATQSSAELGKTAGKDQAQEKVTAVKLLGLEESKRRATQVTQSAAARLQDFWKTVPTGAMGSVATLETQCEQWKKRVHELVAALLEREK